MTRMLATSRIQEREGNVEITGNLIIRGGRLEVTPEDGNPRGTVTISPGPTGAALTLGAPREVTTPLPSGGVSVTHTRVPPEPPPKPVEEKLPPTIYERLLQDD
jgi:hypothetical protein